MFRCFVLVNLLVISIGIGGCSSDEAQPCDNGIMLDHGSCLVFEDHGALDSERDAMKTVVAQTVTLVNSILSIDNLTIRVQVSPANAIPEIGMGGFNPSAEEIIISIDPGFANLSHSVSVELAPLLAHEMHHAKRRRAIGYGSTLLQASVSEGLADCFAMEVTGIDPPIWSVFLSGAVLQDWIDTARNTWTASSYDHDKWFFGSTTDVPRWAGYSIGFKLVKDYISAHPTRKASDLVGEPASSFAQ